MAAIATKKPGGDRGVALTFPANFQKAFSAGVGYYPSGDLLPFDLMVGTNFQSTYHEEKRREANNSVMNGIQNRLSAERKLLTGPHNFHLPKPVLGQRKYANPSFGDSSAQSTRRDNGPDAPFRTIEVGMEGSGMRGGVLTTMEGQTFYNNKLRGRINELNRINALAQGVAVPMGQNMDTFDNRTIGSASKVEFFLFLRALADSVLDGDYNRFTFENMRDLLKRLVSFGPTATEEDLNDILHSVDLMKASAEAKEADELRPQYVTPESVQTIYLLVDKVKDYTDEMLRNINLSDKDRKTLSASLLRSLKLDQFLRKGNEQQLIEDLRSGNRRLNQAAEDFDDGFDPGDDDDDDGRPFGRPPPREDAEQGFAPRAPFAGNGGDPSRDRFGARNGLIVFGGPTNSFFGEAQAEDAQSGFAAPLAFSGFDPQAQVPAQDRSLLRQTVEEIMNQTIQPLKVDGDEDKTIEELVAEKYPQPARFISEVSGALVERGFTPAQIADGMSQLNLPLFADYIAANTGPIEPAAAAPARLPDPQGFLPPAAYPAPGMGGEPAALPAPPKRAAGWKIPANMRTRELLRSNYRTVAQIRELGASIPASAGGPYRPRDGTAVKNALTRIITIAKGVDPSY